MEQTGSRKSWEEASLTDDFIFSKTFLDPKITLELLRRIFPTMTIKGIKILNSQQEIKTTHDAKSSRFDIYVKDYDNRHYDLEIQVENNHNLPQRARFYQSSLATAAYTKVKNYIKANKSFVIFFCCFDSFGLGEQRYDVKRIIENYPNYTYQDHEKSVFFDITSHRKTVGPKLQNVLDLIANRKLDEEDDFIIKLKKRISFVKQNQEWRREYMLRTLYEMDIENKLKEGLKQGHEEGLKQGHEEGLKQGIEQGREEGIEEGIEQGLVKERLSLITDLIKSGQTKEQVENFLINIRQIDPAEAAKDYQEALDKKIRGSLALS
ncbi:hypothetical protein CP356_09600 [Lactobacillus sp. UMNPBX5]|nr:hypothetical protein CP356_09600 [Lactobacillus sp. UMNPBX5]